MATGFTRQAASDILKSRINNLTYIALSTTTPDENGNNFTEPPTANGYQRQEFGTVNSSIQGQVANATIRFLFEATENCGSVTHVGLSQQSNRGGSIFLMAQLDAPLTINAGYVPLIRANSFVVGLDKEALEDYT